MFHSENSARDDRSPGFVPEVSRIPAEARAEHGWTPEHAAPSTLADLPLIEAYEVIEDQSRALLEAAQAGEWEAFDYLQEQCQALVEDIRSNPAPRSLAPEEARRRREILSHILDDDRQIRDILQPGSRRVGALLRMRGTPKAGAE